MKKLAIATAILSALVISGTANAYQTEVGVEYNRISPDKGKNGNGVSVDGAYYFNDVQTKDYPLAEAAFLNNASNVNARYEYQKSNEKINTYGIGTEIYIPDTQFYASANYDFTDNGNLPNGKKATAELGYLPVPNLLLAAGGVYQKTDSRKSETDPKIRAKYVTKFGANDVNLEASGTFGDSKVYNVAGDFYVDRTWSVGSQFERTSFKQGTDENVWGLRTRKFINPMLSVEANAKFGKNTDIYGVGANYRF